MRDQIIEVSGQRPSFAQVAEPADRTAATSYPDAAFWLHVYPPLTGDKAPQPHARVVCPWSLAGQLADSTTPATRRQNILEALKRGLKTIRQYGLPACRIVFTEAHSTREISVWVE